MKTKLKLAACGLFGVLGGLLGSLLLREQKPLSASLESPVEVRAKPAADERRQEIQTKVDRERPDSSPEAWKWTSSMNYRTLGSSGRIGRDVLRIAGLKDEDGPKVQEVFDQAFLRVEQELAKRVRKLDKKTDTENGINYFEIKGDSTIFETNMRALRDELIAKFGMGAAKILYQGFHPESKFQGMGKYHLMVEMHGEIFTDDGGLASYDGPYTRFEIKYFDPDSDSSVSAARLHEVESLRDSLGNLVDLLK